MNPLKELSIIIPIGATESEWPILLSDLELLPQESEIIIVVPDGCPFPQAKAGLRFVQSPPGRAKQMNTGARQARNKFLWFVHADSRIPSQSIEALKNALIEAPSRLHFFDLEFLADGPVLTRLNTLGAWVRARLLGLPFGDQGFCISKNLFESLGRFPENVLYGEDHLFVWKARKSGIPIRSTRGRIYTSSRKYRDKGWAKTTLQHGYLTAKQALPEWISYLAGKGTMK
ncbi:MAG: glycosyltransferase family 2 protein [Parachlamydiales bacterium]